MDDQEYDKNLQVQLPMGLLDDLVAVHVPAEKGQDQIAACRHCNAMQHLIEIRIACAHKTEELRRVDKAKGSGLN